jgi:putative aldouronate transport system substrate-binding protein
VTGIVVSFGTPIPAREENQYWQYLEGLLNVTFDLQAVPASAYPERIATIAASGEFPDLTWVEGTLVPELGQLVEQGAFADLTDYLSGDALAEYPNLARFDPQIWRNVAVNGRIYGVPRPRSRAGGTLMFRQDWAERLGVPRARDAAEFRELLVGFVERDPDGDGQADTWGLSSSDPQYSLPFFQYLFRAPNGWRLGADGRLVALHETEEYRAAVAYARELFAAGVYHPDAGSMNPQQAKDGFSTGAFGGFVDGITALPGGGGGLRTRVRELNPGGNAIGLVPFGHDGGVPVSHNGIGYYGYTTIPASRAGDEERVRELLRLLNWWASPLGSEESLARAGIEGVHYTVEADGTQVRTEQGAAEIGELNTLTNGPSVFYYPNAPAELNDARYMQGLVRDLLAVGVDNPTWALYSPTNAEQGGVLRQLVNDAQAAVIAGREPLEALDRMVADWRGRGGEQIREEYQEALATR